MLKIIKDEGATEDILQDLFVKLWERRERLGTITNVQVYFYKAARSMAINYIKSNKLKCVGDEEVCVEIVFSHEEVVVLRENNVAKNKMLSDALNRLPKRQREILFLKYFDEWDYDHIADVTGIKYQSVVNHVHRAILQLRSELAGEVSNAYCRMAV
jgi:RNA polymerase sigma-70 factor (ECF subfamily)